MNVFFQISFTIIEYRRSKKASNLKQKIMKKIIFGIFATLSLCQTINAQDLKAVSGRISYGDQYLELPTEMKSDKIYSANSAEFLKIEAYSEELNGSIIILTDSKQQIIGITLPPTTTAEKATKYYTCFKKAWADGTGLMGYLECCGSN